jgi:hypothetical protein
VTGIILYQKTLKKNQVQLSGELLKSGMYIYRVRNIQGESLTGKFLVN